MIWEAGTKSHPKDGEIIYGIKFAWWPTKTSDLKWVWLENYLEKSVWKQGRATRWYRYQVDHDADNSDFKKKKDWYYDKRKPPISDRWEILGKYSKLSSKWIKYVVNNEEKKTVKEFYKVLERVEKDLGKDFVFAQDPPEKRKAVEKLVDDELETQ